MGGGGGHGGHYVDADRPRSHVAPPSGGWLNDPNGPVWYKGRYHMFYQWLPHACEWDFGIVWGHAVSSDLVRWEHLPPALVPTPGWVDADGCFSGCCVVEPSGRPVILYTGVRLRSNADAGPLPPPEHDLGTVFIESQCAAVPEDPEDDMLIKWRKVEAPFLPLPPAHMELTGWRDPFIFDFGCNGVGNGAATRSAFQQERKWRMLIGSGLKGQGGTALVYRSTDLMGGWELEGCLCEGSSVHTGVVWECPLLVPLAPVPQHLRARRPHEPPRWLTEAREEQIAEREAAPAVDGSQWAFSQMLPPLASLRHVAPKKQLLQALSAAAAAGAGTAPSGAAADVGGEAGAEAAHVFGGSEPTDEEAEVNFEFSSGGATPGDLTHQPSIEFWPGSSGLNSPVDLAAAGADSAAATAAAVAQVAEAAAKLAHAPTLESWNTAADRLTEVEPTMGSRLGPSPFQCGAAEVEPSIGSRLGSVALSSNGSSSDAQKRPGGKEAVGASLAAAAAAAFKPGAGWEAAAGAAGGDPGLEDEQEEQRVGLKLSSSVDKFAAAFSRVPALHLARGLPTPSSLSSFSSLADAAASSAPPLPPQQRQWHLFTVSPDAPANPVLYWTGFLSDGEPSEVPRFDLPTAKGPFRLDLGDILYAPNVCQDGQGRWLMWGWLQERRKVGSYAYAGCLSLPRVLHCTDEGRLVQAPAPEVAALRQGRTFHAQHVTIYPEALVPIAGVCGERLDIEFTIERGSALAAGLLFRSHEAEAEGSTAVVYDWERNQLEAIFNVPPNWQPCTLPPAEDIFDGGEGFDPASFLCPTPRFSVSREPSMAALSPLLSRDPTAAAEFSSQSDFLGGDLESVPSVGDSIEEEASESLLPPTSPLPRSGSSLAVSLHRSSSNLMAIPGAGAGGVMSRMGGGAVGGGGGAFAVGSLPKVGSFPRIGSFPRRPSFLGSPRGSQAVDGDAAAADLDADLDTLLEDLAAPMRGPEEAAQAPAEPRRVGGPLLMRPSDRLHLRIIVDHSCVEVYTGTGEVLSTRIYRGQAPEEAGFCGLDFVAFGGPALLERVSAWEMGPAWAAQREEETPTAAAADGLADVFRRQPSTPAGTGTGTAVGSPVGGGGMAAERADALFEDLLMAMPGLDLGLNSPTAPGLTAQ